MECRRDEPRYALLGDADMNISTIGVSGDLGLGITFLVLGSIIRSNRLILSVLLAVIPPHFSAKTAFLPATSKIIHP